MRFFSNAGSKEKPIRQAIKNGDQIEVKTVGYENIQDFINSFEDSCNISSLVARATRDPRLLIQREGMYGDFTDAPNTYAEYLNKINSVKADFDNLPEEIKKNFNNNPVVWFNSVNDDDFMEKMGFVSSEVQKESGDVNES